MSIPNKPRAVVTGGAGGLGRAFCLALAARGAKILVSDVDLAGAEQTAAEVGRRGGSGHAVRCDVSDPAEVQRLLEEADAKLGGVDLVVNNAGVAVAGPVGEIPLEDWRWITAVNYWGVIHGCHTFLPRFKQQGSGHVLNVASTAGLVSAPLMAPYNMTKAAVVALSETLAGELHGTGIGVTVLCPTFFRTNIMASSRRTAMDDGGMETVVNYRMDSSKLQADDVARVALEACDRGLLYAVPMSDGQWSWRMKRLMPERFHTVMPKVMAKMRERAASKRS